MRIALFITQFPVLSESFVVRQIDGLAKQGHHIDVYAQTCCSEEVVFPQSFCSIDLKSICHVSRGYQSASKIWRIISLIKNLFRYGINPRAFRGFSSSNARWWLKAVFECDSLVASEYDIILGHFGPNSLRAIGHSEARFIKGPIVAHFHGCDVSSMLKYPWYRRSLFLIFEKSKAVIAVSNWMKLRLVSLGCPEDKIVVIPCGASLEQIKPSKFVDSQSCIFLSVGRMCEEKGPLFALKAFNEHLRDFPNSTFTMVGAGPLLADVRQFVSENDLDAAVTVMGGQPLSVVHDLLESSSVFVQHSIETEDGWVEGWGVSMAEAAGAGIPVLATRTGGIPDHVLHAKTGLLVDQKDWGAMAQAMNQLARSPELRLKMGRNGKENIFKTGNATVQVDKLCSLLNIVSKQSR